MIVLFSCEVILFAFDDMALVIGLIEKEIVSTRAGERSSTIYSKGDGLIPGDG